MAKEYMKSNRKLDTQTTHEVEKFLDKYYTETLPSFVRVTSRELQLQGIDVIFTSASGDDFLVDEKCATDYINKDLQTFSFELRASSDRNTGFRYDGWLISNQKSTTHYLLAYINRCDVDKYPREEDIREVEIILISKHRVIQYLSELGWTKEALKQKCDDIDSGIYNFGKIEDGVKFSKSKHKIEAPINVIIPRDKLREMSLHNTIIRRPIP